jgi:hypothetical protein
MICSLPGATNEPGADASLARSLSVSRSGPSRDHDAERIHRPGLRSSDLVAPATEPNKWGRFRSLDTPSFSSYLFHFTILF